MGKIRNATITHAEIQIDRGFILTAWLTLDYGGSGQGFGGYVLGGIGDAACANHRKQPNYAAEFITRVMKAAGVEKWSDLVGKNVRVEQGHDKVIWIGHITKDTLCFNPEDTFKVFSTSGPAAESE